MKEIILNYVKENGLNINMFRMEYKKGCLRPFQFSNGVVTFEISIATKEMELYNNSILPVKSFKL